MTASPPSLVLRADTRVRYVEVADELSQIRAAWPTLETAVGSLRGRRFVGAFADGRYRACVVAQDDASAAERDLPETVIPGGRFARIRLRGEPPAVYDEIAPAYTALESWAQPDENRPGLEYYRRLDEIDVLMPVAEP